MNLLEGFELRAYVNEIVGMECLECGGGADPTYTILVHRADYREPSTLAEYVTSAKKHWKEYHGN